MKNMIKIVFVAIVAAIAGYGVYTSQKSSIKLGWSSIEVEALAGCEVSSSGSSNGGYCSSNYGGSGDSCTTTGDSGAVRCSGNF
ncbi:NVEALA domain-containing protein [Parabacteroides bouchesdurhonensis]|uniref:NVEALA domain-containing protein n=1 Tax=Parabacteroides bouchesdurhonensis TaxID=1936995 RepID=UPI000C84389D|nr:NVEALA domain-containing protein [Parabacteroides bouchesdurhonensis]RHJ91734.1 hypothetical protein DW095_09490 [Bacteroides sp. AM07-16]